jgi:hypothetical protein
MYYLSQAIEEAVDDVQNGRISVTKTETGDPFD